MVGLCRVTIPALPRGRPVGASRWPPEGRSAPHCGYAYLYHHAAHKRVCARPRVEARIMGCPSPRRPSRCAAHPWTKGCPLHAAHRLPDTAGRALSLELPHWLGLLVRAGGFAPPPAVWKTAALLNELCAHMELKVGVEPTTCRLQGGCSAKLSYSSMVLTAGYDPAASALPKRCATSCATSVWYPSQATIPQPPRCKLGALPVELDGRSVRSIGPELRPSVKRRPGARYEHAPDPWPVVERPGVEPGTSTMPL